MKVGEILKEEIQDKPGLQCPYKIKVNKKYKYPFKQKMENSIFIESCNTFLNSFQNRNKIVQRQRSFSQRKTITSLPSTKCFLKLNSVNYPKKPELNLFNDNFPLINDSKHKIKRKLSLDIRNIKNSKHKIKRKLSLDNNEREHEYKTERKLSSDKNNFSPILNPNSIFKNKINKIKHFNRKMDNIISNSLPDKKRKIIPSIKEQKPIIQIRIENIFNTVLGNKNKKINKRYLTQNIFEYRIKNKLKAMDNIINKLNTPIFIINKSEMN